MRNYHSNKFDNMSYQMNNKIRDSIDASFNRRLWLDDRDPMRARDGVLGFNGFQLFNPKNVCYAVFGAGSTCSSVVGV